MDMACGRKEEYRCNKATKDDENNIVLTNSQMALLEDQRQELADLKRQVVFLTVSSSEQFWCLIRKLLKFTSKFNLSDTHSKIIIFYHWLLLPQGQLDDKERIIKVQRTKIEQLSKEGTHHNSYEKVVEKCASATQTDRIVSYS